MTDEERAKKTAEAMGMKNPKKVDTSNGAPVSGSMDSMVGGGLKALDVIPGDPLANTILNIGTGAQNDFKAKEYDPNTGSYQIGNQYGDALGQALVGAQGRATPTVAGPDLAQADQARGMQMGLAGALQARAAGQAPSAAQIQMQQGLAQAIATQRAQAASARGVSPAMAQRMAAQGIANAQQQTVAQGAQLRAQEQAQAETALGQHLASVRGQDFSGAGLQQQTTLANQQAELANRAQMDQATQAYIAQGMSREEAQQKALAEMEALKAEQRTSANKLEQATAEANAGRQQQAQGGILSAAGSIVGGILSDRRAKENIGDGGKEVDAMLSEMKPMRFDYKKEHGGGKDYLGFMAQDAEKSPLGRALVMETGRGKMIDSGRALMAALASSSRLHHRLSKLEASRG